MREVVAYRGFDLVIERRPGGWRVRVVSPQRAAAAIPHHLQQVTKLKKDDAVAEAKAIVDYMIGH